MERGKAGGPYAADEIENLSPALIERYFRLRACDTVTDAYYVAESLRRRLTFDYHNLLSDPFESGFDLIVCRNVVIYFTAEVKKRLYRQFYDALRPGGVMFVGGTEVIPKATELDFETVGISFYRRRDTA